MPDIRGNGLPFINTQPWKLPRVPPNVDYSIPGPVTNFPTGGLIQLARNPLSKPRAHSTVIRPPVVLFSPPPRFSTRLTPSRPRLAVGTPRGVRPPAIVNPAPVSGPTGLLIAITRTPKSIQIRARSIIRPPVVLQTTTVYTPPPLETRLSAKTRPSTAAKSQLRPPAVITPAPPAGIPPIETRLAAKSRPLVTAKSVLRPPTTVAASIPAFLPTMNVRLAAKARAIIWARSIIRPPVAVATPVVTQNYPTGGSIQLARSQARYRVGLGGVRDPAVIAPPFTPKIPLRAELATAFPVELRRVRYRILPPVAVTAATPPTLRQRTIAVKLAKRQWAVQPTHSRVRAPIVVSPFVPPVITVNAGTDWAAEMSTW